MMVASPETESLKLEGAQCPLRRVASQSTLVEPLSLEQHSPYRPSLFLRFVVSDFE
jgi:hypothetical protein